MKAQISSASALSCTGNSTAEFHLNTSILRDLACFDRLVDEKGSEVIFAWNVPQKSNGQPADSNSHDGAVELEVGGSLNLRVR